MIESKTLGAAAGIQRQDVIDNSETTVLPSLNKAVMIGRFKRGRMDKAFAVTATNYKAMLGYDPSNKSYLAIEDAFKRGISEVSILRTGGFGVTPAVVDTSVSYINTIKPPVIFNGEYGEYNPMEVL